MAELKRRDILDQTQTYTPLSVLNEDYQPPTPEVTEAGIGELWDEATRRHWVGESLSRGVQALDVENEDRDYSVDMNTLKEYNDKGYSEQELQFLAESTSGNNFIFRESQVKADRTAKTTLEQAGMKGFGVEMAAAIFDPSMIPLMFVGTPEVVAAKVGAVGKVGWSMLRGGAEGLLSEYLLKQNDTQRTERDLYLSAIGGMAFSGAIDLTGMAAKSATNALTRANRIDADKSITFKANERGDAYNKAHEVVSEYQVDTVATKRFLSEKDIIDVLRKDSGDRVDVMSKSKVKELKDEFRAYRKGRESVIAKINARPNLRPAARAAEIKNVTDAIARRESEMNEKIALNVAARSRNSDIDALQQGVVPEKLQARYKEIKAERGEFDVTPNTIPKIQAGHKLPVSEGEKPELLQSVGAMKTRTEFDDIQTFDNLLSEVDVEEIENSLLDAERLGDSLPRNNRIGEVPAPLRSLYTSLDSAPDSMTRGLVAKLLKNPQRTTKGLQSAEEVADTLFYRSAPDYIEYIGHMESWMREQGAKWWQIGKKNQLEQEFDRLTVMMQASGNLLSNKPVDGDSAVMLAAKARSRLYEMGLKNNQDYNVIGFENIKHRHEYHSIVFSTDNIRRMSDKHADFIYDAVANAYMTGGIRLSRENAVRLAQTQVSRAMAVKGHAHKSFDRFMSDSEFKLMEKEMLEKGMSRDVINDIKEALFDKEKMGEISPRAMFSLRPNIKARSGDVWFVDTLDTSINRNMKYVSDSAANAGLAANGFRSKHQYQRSVAAARDAAINDLRKDVEIYKGTKAGAEAEKALQEVTDGKYANWLDESLRLLYREPLEDADGLKDASRIMRKATSVVRLRTTGLATLPEAATASVRNGLISTLKQIPATRWFDFRERSVSKDKFMMDFARTFSATGHQEYLFGKKFYNGSDFDDATRGSLQKIDRQMGNALDITLTVNGFKTMQHGGEEMVARSIVNNLRDFASKGEITSEIRKSLIDVGGMTDEQVTRMAAHFKSNDLDIFDSIRLMDAELHNSLSTAVRNTIGHSYLRMSIGEQPAYMNKEMGKVLTSLMSFTIGSYEKMLLRGIKNERAIMLSATAGQAVLGYGALVANTYIQSLGMKDSERRKYIKDKLDDDNALWGTMARVGVFATPMIPLQMMNTLGALPEEMKGVGRMGGVQSTALAADAVQAASSAGKLALTKQTRREEEQSMDSIKRVLPWYNSTLYNLTIGAASN